MKQSSDDHIRPQHRSSDLPAWSIWLAWPALSVSISFAICVISALMTSPDDPLGAGLIAIPLVGAWAMPVFDVAFESLGVTATLFVAVAAVTRFTGNWSELDRDATRVIPVVILVPAILLTALSAFTLPASLADPSRAPRLVAFWILAWAVTTSGIDVSRIETKEERIERDASALAAAQRLPRALRCAPPARGAYVVALVASWVIIPTLWVVWSAIATHVWSGGAQLFWSTAIIGVGPLLARLGWVALQDRTGSRGVNAYGYLLAGMGVIMIAGASVIAFPFAPLMLGLPLAILALATSIHLIPAATSRVWPFTILVRHHTARGFANLLQKVEENQRTELASRGRESWMTRALGRLSRAVPPR